MKGYLNIDATAGSVSVVGNNVKFDVSPMWVGPVKYKGSHAKNFHNFMEYGKVYRDLKHIGDDGEVTPAWIKFRKNGYKKTGQKNGKILQPKHPTQARTNEVKSTSPKGKKFYKYLKPEFAFYGDEKSGEKLGYIATRKVIFAPIYADLVSDSEVVVEMKKWVECGVSIQILDYDGPQESRIVTTELLREKINDASVPFGHGYVLAGMLKGIHPSDYV